MKINQGIVDLILFGLLCAIVVTLPFQVKINGFFLIVFTALSLVKLVSDSKTHFSFLKKNSVLVAVFTSMFLVHLAFFFFSGFQNGFALEKKISFLLLPLIMGAAILPLNQRKINILFLCVIGSVLISVLASFRMLDQFYFVQSEDRFGVAQSNLMLDRPYFGLYLVFSIMLLYYLFWKTERAYVRFFIIVISILLLYSAYLILAKIAIIALVLVSILTSVFISIKTKRIYWHSSIPVIALIGLVILLILRYEKMTDSLNHIINFIPFDMTEGKWIYYLSINTRFVLWECSWNLLKENYHWIFGAGANYQDILNSCHTQTWGKYGIKTELGISEEFLSETLNPHNQFIETWLATGIAGLVSLVTLFFVSIKEALKRNNYIFFSFVLLFVICCFTESLLERQKGIVLFAVFNSIFLFSSKVEDKVGT